MFSNAADLLEFISANKNAENRVCEYKSRMSWNEKDNKEFRYEIIRAILAMSNLQDGGYVIIGVQQDRDNMYQPLGMNEDEALTYEYDKVLEMANSFADPYVTLEIKPFPYNNKWILVIQVFEFVDIPVICKKKENVSYLVVHEPIGGEWERKSKVKRVRRCYINNPNQRNVILKKLGRYIQKTIEQKT